MGKGYIVSIYSALLKFILTGAITEVYSRLMIGDTLSGDMTVCCVDEIECCPAETFRFEVRSGAQLRWIFVCYSVASRCPLAKVRNQVCQS